VSQQVWHVKEPWLKLVVKSQKCYNQRSKFTVQVTAARQLKIAHTAVNKQTNKQTNLFHAPA
jgi:hypothetical protein